MKLIKHIIDTTLVSFAFILDLMGLIEIDPKEKESKLYDWNGPKG